MKMINNFKSKLAGFKATTKIIQYMIHTQQDEVDIELEPDTPSIQQAMAEHDNKYRHKLSVKLKARVTDKCLDYIDELWASVTEYLYLPTLLTLLKSICDGCIEVTWLIPSRLVQEIKAQAQRLTVVAQQYDIVTVKLDNGILYPDNSEVSVMLTSK